MIRSLAACLVVAYLAVVGHLTLTDPATGQWAFSLADRAASRLSGGRLTWTETEALANVALFVPLGFLLALALDRRWPAAAVGAGTSVAVEWAQLHVVTSRVPTVADVVHNSAGALLGALLAGLAVAAARPARPAVPSPVSHPGPPARRTGEARGLGG